MGQLVQSFKRKPEEYTRVYCESITLGPLGICQELLVDMKGLSHGVRCTGFIWRAEYFLTEGLVVSNCERGDF